MNTHAPTELTIRLQRRHRLTEQLRHFFNAQDFLEVDTPVALTAPAPELCIEACPVQFTLDGQIHKRFLQTSPELPMKRLVAAGLEKIYQIAVVFRDHDHSPQHRPEFRMLEWYRAHAPWTQLMQDCEQLLVHLHQACQHLPVALRPDNLPECSAPFARMRVNEAFARFAGFELLDYPTSERLYNKLCQMGVHCHADDDFNDLFCRIFIQKVEPALLQHYGSQPFFLTHFPAPLASLAQLDPDDPRTAQRFELYAGGMELANGFGELVDAQEQRVRFANERLARQKAGRADYPIDERFLRALAQMPSTSGIALGMERLWMYLTGATQIDEISAFSWSHT